MQGAGVERRLKLSNDILNMKLLHESESYSMFKMCQNVDNVQLSNAASQLLACLAVHKVDFSGLP